MSMSCRLCGEPLHHVAVDLGSTPLANSYLKPDQLATAEKRYPLRALLCGKCFLVQLDTLADPQEIFGGGEYAYFSSYSETLLKSSAAYAAQMCRRLGLTPNDRVIEIASNDGYLLRHFLERGIPVLGIEPAANVARAAVERGVPSLTRFFGTALARELASAGTTGRLIVANNVLAHVPDINDFLAGIHQLLAPKGLFTVEFHHLLSLVERCQFDTIYHEHYQYFSLRTASTALSSHGLTVVDVERLPAQGGSLRVFAMHTDDAPAEPSAAVRDILAQEQAAGLYSPARYVEFAHGIATIRRNLLAFLTNARQAGKSVVCYGAAAKGNTLLNYCGIGTDLIQYAVDRSPHKQGLFLPGSRIPIHHPDRVLETRPDYLLILPWNLCDEIMEQMSAIRRWGGQFVVPVPDLRLAA
jgi:SAM-dependent methyltransferase